MFDWVVISLSEYSIIKTLIFSILILAAVSLLTFRLAGQTLRAVLLAIVFAGICLAAIENYTATFGLERGTLQYQVNSFVLGVVLMPPTNIILILLVFFMVSSSPDVLVRRKKVLIPTISLSLAVELLVFAVAHFVDKF
ncbi:hypothetical protein ACC676_18615 [Rhizobium ruizarguesonis]